MLQRDKSLLIGLFTVSIIVVSIWTQAHIFLSFDVCWLLEATHRFLAGGTYIHNFVEIDPPMILYVYSLPVLLSQWLHINIIHVFYSYVYLIGFFSLYTIYRLLSQLPTMHTRIQTISLITLTTVFFLFPISEFGQREHITLMLILPYILLATLNLHNIRVSAYSKIIWGILAGIGFGIKPYFLPALVFIEISMLIYSKRWLAWLRLETLLCGAVLILYLAAIFIVTPGYISRIIPMLQLFYVHFQLHSWWALIFRWDSWPIYSALIITCFLYRFFEQAKLTRLLTATMLGFYIGYLWQGKVWYVHAYPMIALAFYLGALLIPIYINATYQHTLKSVVFWLISAAYLLLIFILFNLGLRTNFYIQMFKNPANTTNQIIRYTKQHARNGTIYIMSTTSPPGGIVPIYSGVASASRYPDLWIVPGYLRIMHTSSDSAQKKQALSYLNFMAQGIIADFKQHHPTVVYIDIAKHKKYLATYPFSFLKLLTSYPEFKQLWKAYTYKTQLGRFAVYQRKLAP